MEWEDGRRCCAIPMVHAVARSLEKTTTEAEEEEQEEKHGVDTEHEVYGIGIWYGGGRWGW